MERKKGSSKRRQKVSDRKLKNMPSIDRLGALPDAVICHILSFIPTKFSVRTSILARRWRFIWTHVPTLDFNFLEDIPTLPTHSSDIINRVMLLHKVQSINTFCIPSLDNIREYELDTWITTAISRNVQNIDISFCFEEEQTLPRCLFTCKTLVNLSLRSCAGIPSSGPVFLPSLKKLKVDMILCEAVEALPHLLSGCPVLEELIIDHIHFTDEDVGGCLNISSPTIKRLDVHTPWDCQMFTKTLDMVKINAPALENLQVAGYLKLYSILPINSLSEAHVDLDTDMLVQDYTTCSLVKLLYPLCDVKCLTLTGYSNGKELFPDPIAAGSIPKFGNLTKLELSLSVNWHFVMRLLESADNLEILTVGVGLTNWVEPEQVPTCLLSCVRTIRINNIQCTEHGYSMVKYLLRIAQVLERMDILFHRSHYVEKKTKSDARKRITKFGRGSKACADCVCIKFSKTKGWPGRRTPSFSEFQESSLDGIITINPLFCTEQVRYLLRNAKVLERMEIYSDLIKTDFEAKFDALKKISAFQFSTRIRDM